MSCTVPGIFNKAVSLGLTTLLDRKKIISERLYEFLKEDLYKDYKKYHDNYNNYENDINEKIILKFNFEKSFNDSINNFIKKEYDYESLFDATKQLPITKEQMQEFFNPLGLNEYLKLKESEIFYIRKSFNNFKHTGDLVKDFDLFLNNLSDTNIEYIDNIAINDNILNFLNTYNDQFEPTQEQIDKRNSITNRKEKRKYMNSLRAKQALSVDSQELLKNITSIINEVNINYKSSNKIKLNKNFYKELYKGNLENVNEVLDIDNIDNPCRMIEDQCNLSFVSKMQSSAFVDRKNKSVTQDKNVLNENIVKYQNSMLNNIVNTLGIDFINDGILSGNVEHYRKIMEHPKVVSLIELNVLDLTEAQKSALIDIYVLNNFDKLLKKNFDFVLKIDSNYKGVIGIKYQKYDFKTESAKVNYFNSEQHSDKNIDKAQSHLAKTIISSIPIVYSKPNSKGIYTITNSKEFLSEKHLSYFCSSMNIVEVEKFSSDIHNNKEPKSMSLDGLSVMKDNLKFIIDGKSNLIKNNTIFTSIYAYLYNKTIDLHEPNDILYSIREIMNENIGTIKQQNILNPEVFLQTSILKTRSPYYTEMLLKDKKKSVDHKSLLQSFLGREALFIDLTRSVETEIKSQLNKMETSTDKVSVFGDVDNETMFRKLFDLSEDQLLQYKISEGKTEDSEGNAPDIIKTFLGGIDKKSKEKGTYPAHQGIYTKLKDLLRRDLPLKHGTLGSALDKINSKDDLEKETLRYELITELISKMGLTKAGLLGSNTSINQYRNMYIHLNNSKTLSPINVYPNALKNDLPVNIGSTMAFHDVYNAKLFYDSITLENLKNEKLNNSANNSRRRPKLNKDMNLFVSNMNLFTNKNTLEDGSELVNNNFPKSGATGFQESLKEGYDITESKDFNVEQNLIASWEFNFKAGQNKGIFTTELTSASDKSRHVTKTINLNTELRGDYTAINSVGRKVTLANIGTSEGRESSAINNEGIFNLYFQGMNRYGEYLFNKTLDFYETLYKDLDPSKLTESPDISEFKEYDAVSTYKLFDSISKLLKNYDEASLLKLGTPEDPIVSQIHYTKYKDGQPININKSLYSFMLKYSNENLLWNDVNTEMYNFYQGTKDIKYFKENVYNDRSLNSSNNTTNDLRKYILLTNLVKDNYMVMTVKFPYIEEYNNSVWGEGLREIKEEPNSSNKLNGFNKLPDFNLKNTKEYVMTEAEFHQKIENLQSDKKKLGESYNEKLSELTDDFNANKKGLNKEEIAELTTQYETDFNELQNEFDKKNDRILNDFKLINKESFKLSEANIEKKRNEFEEQMKSELETFEKENPGLDKNDPKRIEFDTNQLDLQRSLEEGIKKHALDQELYSDKNLLFQDFAFENSERWKLYTKRMVSFPGTVANYITTNLVGLPQKIKTATIDDVVANVESITGIKDKFDSADGSAYCLAVYSILEDQSSPGTSYGTSKKPLGVTAPLYGSSLYKYAEHAFTNESCKNVLSTVSDKELTKKMLDLKWDEDLNITKHFSGNITTDVRNYNNGDDIFFQKGFRYYKMESLSHIKTKRGNMNNYKVSYSEVDQNGKVIKQDALTSIEKIDSNYRIWEVFGAERSMELKGGKLVNSEQSNYILANIMNSVGHVNDTYKNEKWVNKLDLSVNVDEFNKLESDNNLVLNNRIIRQPLKEYMIGFIANKSAVKRGIENLMVEENGKSAYSDKRDLNYTIIDLGNFGIQQDPSHGAEGSVTSTPTQLISSLATGGREVLKVDQIYKKLGDLVYNALDPLRFVNSGKSEHELKERISDLIRDKFEESIANKDISDASYLMERALKDIIPVDDSSFYKPLLEVCTQVVNKAIKPKVSGGGDVIVPSYGHIQIIDINGNHYMQNDLYNKSINYFNNSIKDLNKYIEFSENHVKRLSASKDLNSSAILRAIKNNDNNIKLIQETLKKIDIVKNRMDSFDSKELSKKMIQLGIFITKDSDFKSSKVPTDVRTKAVKEYLNSVNQKLIKIIHRLDSSEPEIQKYENNKDIQFFDNIIIKDQNGKSENISVTSLKELRRVQSLSKDFEIYRDLEKPRDLKPDETTYILDGEKINLWTHPLVTSINALDLNNGHYSEKNFIGYYAGTAINDIIDNLPETVKDKYLYDNNIADDTAIGETNDGSFSKVLRNKMTLLFLNQINQGYDFNYKKIYSDYKKDFEDIDKNPELNIVDVKDLGILGENKSVWTESIFSKFVEWALTTDATLSTETLPKEIEQYLIPIEKNSMINTDAECIVPKKFKSEFNIGSKSLIDLKLNGLEHDVISNLNVDKNSDLRILSDKINFNVFFDKVPDHIINDEKFTRVSFDVTKDLSKSFKKINGEMFLMDGKDQIMKISQEFIDGEGMIYKNGNNKFNIYLPEKFLNLNDKKNVNGDTVKKVFDFISSFNNSLAVILKYKDERLKSDLYDNLNPMLESFNTIKPIKEFYNKEYNNNKNYSEYDNFVYNDLNKKIRKYEDLSIDRGFDYSNRLIAARIPGTGLQSEMNMDVVGYNEADVNNIYVTHYHTWLQGSDFDIDKIYMVMANLGKQGQFKTHNKFTDFSTQEKLKSSLDMPIPSNKYYNFGITNNTDLKEMSTPFNALLHNTLKTKIKTGSYDMVDFITQFRDLNVSEHEYINKDFLIKNVALEESLINRESNIYSELLQLMQYKESHPEDTNIKNLDYYEKGMSDYKHLEKTLNVIIHNINTQENFKYNDDVSKNMSFVNMLFTNDNLTNKPDAYNPVDTRPMKDIIAKYNPDKTKQSFGDGNYSVSVSQMNANIGKKDVGIFANGAKVFMNMTQVLNKTFNNLLKKELDSSYSEHIKSGFPTFKLFNNKHIIRERNYVFNTISDLHMTHDQISEMYSQMHNIYAEKGYELISAKDNEEFCAKKEISNYQDYENKLIMHHPSINQDLKFSELTNLATDNAKELQLSSINAMNKVAGIHVALAILGCTREEIVAYTTSDIFREYAHFISNKANAKKSFGSFLKRNIGFKIDYARIHNVELVSPKGAIIESQEKIVDKMINTDVSELKKMKDFAGELRDFASELGINQGIPTELDKIDKFQTSFSRYMQNIILKDSEGKDMVNNSIEKIATEFGFERELIELINDRENPLDVNTLTNDTVDFYRFFHNEKYSDLICKIYDYEVLRKNKFINYYKAIKSSPHYFEMLKGLSEGFNALVKTSDKIYTIFNYGKDLHKNYSGIIDEQYYKKKDMDIVTILYDEHKILDFIQNKKYDETKNEYINYKKDGNSTIKNILSLTDKTDIISNDLIRNWVDVASYDFFVKIREGNFETKEFEGKKVDDSNLQDISTNYFLQEVVQGSVKDITHDKKDAKKIIYKIKHNILSNDDPTYFSKMINGFNLISDYTVKLNNGNIVKVGDFLYLYNMIVHKNALRRNGFTRIFQNYNATEGSLGNRYLDFQKFYKAHFNEDLNKVFVAGFLNNTKKHRDVPYFKDSFFKELGFDEERYNADIGNDSHNNTRELTIREKTLYQDLDGNKFKYENEELSKDMKISIVDSKKMMVGLFDDKSNLKSDFMETSSSNKVYSGNGTPKDYNGYPMIKLKRIRINRSKMINDLMKIDKYIKGKDTKYKLLHKLDIINYVENFAFEHNRNNIDTGVDINGNQISIRDYYDSKNFDISKIKIVEHESKEISDTVKERLDNFVNGMKISEYKLEDVADTPKERLESFVNGIQDNKIKDGKFFKKINERFEEYKDFTPDHIYEDKGYILRQSSGFEQEKTYDLNVVRYFYNNKILYNSDKYFVENGYIYNKDKFLIYTDRSNRKYVVTKEESQRFEDFKSKLKNPPDDIVILENEDAHFNKTEYVMDNTYQLQLNDFSMQNKLNDLFSEKKLPIKVEYIIGDSHVTTKDGITYIRINSQSKNKFSEMIHEFDHIVFNILKINDKYEFDSYSDLVKSLDLVQFKNGRSWVELTDNYIKQNYNNLSEDGKIEELFCRLHTDLINGKIINSKIPSEVLDLLSSTPSVIRNLIGTKNEETDLMKKLSFDGVQSDLNSYLDKSESDNLLNKDSLLRAKYLRILDNILEKTENIKRTECL